MAEVPHPLTVVQPKLESKEKLVRSLDDLLKRYLHLLDQYQTLQQSLAQLLARVWIDLAGYLDSDSICTGLSITCSSQLFKSESYSLRPGSLR